MSRKARIFLLTAPLLFTAFLPLSLAHTATPRTLVGKIERVSDGDTIRAFNSAGTKLRIRLLGIDAPEVSRSTIQATPLERFE